MSIEVRVPEEIEDYKESIIAGLSLRQLLWGFIALVLGIPTYLLLYKINLDLATYATMIIVLPAFLMGFIKKDGYTFEKILKIRIKTYLGKSKRSYETNPEKNIIPIEINEYRIAYEAIKATEKATNETSKNEVKNIVSSKKQKNDPRKINSAKNRKQGESSLVEVTKESIKRKRKTTLKAIKSTRRKTFKTK